ncbi:MAG: cation:proton antiporter [Candidatus Bathyarchaeota archaeon]
MDANIIVILISLTLFLAYTSGILFTLTRVPDIVWMIGFGILFGPVLGIFKADNISNLTPFVVVMALNLLLFEAGLSVDLKTFKESLQKSGYLGVITFSLTVFVIGNLLHFILPATFTITEGLLFGAMIGGTSTSTVLSILGCMGMSSNDAAECRLFLVLESIVTDSLSIVTTMTLIRLIQMPEIPLTEGVKDIVFVFIVAILVGFGVGVLWVQILDVARNRPFNYIMTIAMLSVSYTFGEQIGGPGAGALSGLVFGLTMTNYPIFASRFKLKQKVRVEKRRLRAFYEEITFLIKSILFLFVGLQFSFSAMHIALGVGLAIVIGLIRYSSVTVTGFFVPLSQVEVKVSRLEFSNGLTALVLSQVPGLVEGSHLFTDTGVFVNLIVPIVMTTALFGAIAGPILYEDKPKPELVPNP